MLHNPMYNIIFDLRGVLFEYHPEYRGTQKQFSLIKDMGILLHQLAAQTDLRGKQRHRLFILSNATEASYQNFITYHGEIFSYFEGIVVSAFSGFQKPDKQAYLYLMNKYNLIPESSIFIDDKEENVESARSVGIQAIMYESPIQINRILTDYKAL